MARTSPRVPTSYAIKLAKCGFTMKEWAMAHGFNYDSVRKATQGMDYNKYPANVYSPMGQRILFKLQEFFKEELPSV